MRWLAYLLCMFSVLVLPGCGGSDDDDAPAPTPGQPLQLIIREWRFPESKPQVNILSGEYPQVTNGVQFDLMVIPPDGGSAIKAPFSKVQFARSTPLANSLEELKDDAFITERLEKGVVFDSIKAHSWADPNVGNFYRIDEQSLTSLYRINACVLIDEKSYNAQVIMRVFCVDTP